MGRTWGALQTASLSGSPAIAWMLRALRGSWVDTKLLGQYFQEAAPLLFSTGIQTPRQTQGVP